MLLRAHDLVRVCDAANIFHGAIFVVRAHHVINLRERIPGSKVLLVEVQSRLCDPKDQLVPQILHEGLPNEDSLWHIHWVIVLKHQVGTCTDGV